MIATAKHYLIHAFRFNLFFLCVVENEASLSVEKVAKHHPHPRGATQVPPLLVLEFIHRIGDVLQDYLGEVREDVVKENFVLLYQLLDEVPPSRRQMSRIEDSRVRDRI